MIPKTPLSEMSLTFDFDDIGETDITVEYYFYPGYPAKLNALPEDCYPSEAAEVELQEIFDMDGNNIFASDKDFDAIQEWLCENHEAG